MKQKQNIVLVGFMGTGKTGVGKLLADKLSMSFVDMDDVIEKQEGKSISSIFAEDGEPYFRSLERKLVRELSQKSGLVIGTGGGVVLNHYNIKDFSRTGLVVCLTAKPEIILERVAEDTDRPLLAEGNKLEKIKTMLDRRKQFYDAIPDRIDTTKLTINEIADKIIELYRA